MKIIRLSIRKMLFGYKLTRTLSLCATNRHTGGAGGGRTEGEGITSGRNLGGGTGRRERERNEEELELVGGEMREGGAKTDVNGDFCRGQPLEGTQKKLALTRRRLHETGLSCKYF